MTIVGPLVLLVEDDPQMRRFLRATLTARGFRLLEAETLAAAEIAATSQSPDLVLLDLGLPDGDGIDLARRLREWTQVPILVISARGCEADKVHALDAGADDYVTKPFGVDELLARLRASLRRAGPPGDPVVQVGDVRLDLDKRLVTVRGAPVPLTPHEFGLLRLFMTNLGKLLTHKAILREVWGPAYQTESHYLHVYVSQLRRKLEPDPTRPRYLLTEPGAGYRFVDPTEPR